MSNPEPRVVALQDQLAAHLAALAPTLGQFFHALLEQGFMRDEAMQLVRDYYERHLWLAEPDDD